ncbi:type II toxin-antitoxin system RelE/ParE family toxin [Methylolobus aquaticus]
MERTSRAEIPATAEADVFDIWDYMAQDSPEAASAFILRREEQIGALERFPKRFPYIPEIRLLAGW